MREPTSLSATPDQTSVELLYATDRLPANDKQGQSAYTARRGLALRFGVASVRYGPRGLSADELRERVRRNGRPVISIDEVRDIGRHWLTIPISDEEASLVADDPDESSQVRAGEQAFIQSVNSRLGPGGRVLVYVPGFNTSFQMPIRLVSNLTYLLENQTLAIAFSWPSRNDPLGYRKQQTTAKISIRNLRELLVLLAEKTNVRRIDILSFSAGAPLLTDTLHQLRLMNANATLEELRSSLRIGRVIYAGADEDIDRFRNMYLDGFAEVAESITIYTSRRDRGLILSRLFAHGATRLGRANGALTDRDREALRRGSVTSIVDVSHAQIRAGGGDIWAHAYWYGNPWVSADVVAQLRFDLSPAERGLEWSEDEAAWVFPNDYPERIVKVFRAAEQSTASEIE